MLANRKKFYRINDHKIVKVHDYLYSRHKYAIIFITLALYSVILLYLSEKLAISSNYFVILPLIVVAVSFGFKGGLIAGVLSLPANLLFFSIIGHREFAPENLLIAEISGILVGSVLGYISDFFTMMKKEMLRRQESELSLEKMVREKEVLLKEINHRVKNNLNFIKSLIQLQSNRIKSPEQLEELKKLSRRIVSIALVQDLLFSQESMDIVDFRIYLTQIADNLLSAYSETEIIYELIMEDSPLMLESKKLTSLGLIVNEIITNAEKYAFPSVEKPRFRIVLSQIENRFHLTFTDNGPGMSENINQSGLGLKLIRTLTSSLEGHFEIHNKNGTVITMDFPC